MTAWDRTRKWVLHRVQVKKRRLVVVFQQEGPSVKELMALRSLVAKYAQLPPPRLKSIIGLSRTLDIGGFAPAEAQRLKAKASELGLLLQEEATSHISYLPVDTSGCMDEALLICDDAEAERVAQEMIAAGVPVKDEVVD